MTRVAFTLLVSTVLLGSFAAVGSTQVRNFEPVTNAELLNPDPGDWINWRRTLNGQGYSPLDQVTRDNVADLKLAWSISIRPGNPLRSHKCGGDRHIPSPGGSRTVVRTPPQKVPLALSPGEPGFQAMVKGSRAEGDGSTST